jgi:hypothetical protein
MKSRVKLFCFAAILVISSAAAGCAGSTVYVSGGVGYGGYYGPNAWGGYGGYGGYPGGTVVIGAPPRLY